MTPAHFTEVLFIGFFTAAGLYSALLFLITRDRPFLLYAALMDTAAAAQLVFAGDLMGLERGTRELAVFRTVCYLAFFMAQAGFTWSYLRLAITSPKTARVLGIILAVNLAALFVQLGGLAGPYQAVNHVLFVVLIGACGWAGVAGLRAGDESARYFVLGYGGAAFGMVLSGVAEALHLGSWPEYFFQFAVAWQGALLALALSGAYAKLDPLTGVKSRHAFDERLNAAWKRASENWTGLCLIIVAAGGIKEYEARAGRVAADALLRRIANFCAGCCRDRADLFARYGDHAFAAIIQGATRAQADFIAARMRETVAADCLVPIGVGVSSNENAISAEALVQQAARRSARDTIARSGLILAEH